MDRQKEKQSGSKHHMASKQGTCLDSGKGLVDRPEKRDQWRRWLGITMAASLAILIVLGGLVIVVDPFFHFHKPLEGLAYNIDSERYQNDGISRNFTYDAVITGTSMTENLKTSRFDRLFGVTSIKIPFGGGYYKEVDEAVRRAISYQPQLKLVFRGLDRSFILNRKDDWNPAAPTPAYLYDQNPWNDVNYILNKEVIFGNIRSVIANTMAGGRTTTFDEYMHWAPEKEWGREAVLNTYGRPDGVMDAVPFTQEDKKIVADNVEQNVISVAKEYPDIMFYYFIPPYSIAYWHSELVAKGELDRQIAALRLMTDMILTCDNIQLYGFDDQFDITCSLDHYMDVIHYSEDIGDRILEWIAAGEHRITSENADEYFDTIADFYANYDYSSIYE